MAVGRFQVMAVLQAARAVTLGLPLDSAFSWGLNRAIFYAAAKRGFKGTSKAGTGVHGGKGAPGVSTQVYHLGDELAYKEEKGGKLYFVIGGKPQTRADFEKQIESRFGGKFDEAWKEALDYVGHFDDATLRSGEGFFASVYRPKRDELAAEWTEMSEEAPRPTRRSK